MKNIRIKIKMKNFFDYKKLKNQDHYDCKQIIEDTKYDSESNDDDVKSHKNLSTISKSIITGNSNNKVIPNVKLPTSTTILANFPVNTTVIATTKAASTTTTSTNKATITTIKNPLLNLDEQDKKSYSNKKYNNKKKNSKSILKTIKFPRKYLVQQKQQYYKNKIQQNLKQKQKEIQSDFCKEIIQKEENLKKNNNNNINCYNSNKEKYFNQHHNHYHHQEELNQQHFQKTFNIIRTKKNHNKKNKSYSIISDIPFIKTATAVTVTTATTTKNIKLNYKTEENFINRPKSKIYDYMKDFLRKKFNTLTPTSSRKETTASSSLHEEDIYVEFPNCLLKVINNNLGSQNHKEIHQNHHHHPHHHHHNQQDYQTDTKKLQQSDKQYLQQKQQQQQELQQQQQQPSHQQLPSSSIDNNIKRFDVMQDVRIRLEQIHKQQQKQQQQQQHNQSNNFQQQQQQQNFQFQQQQQNHLHNHNHNQNQNNHNSNSNTPTHHQHNHHHHGGSPNISNNITPRHRPIHLFSATANLNTNGNEPPPHSPSSEEDNSPTEMNNCRRLVDKPPLVKRITMGLFGLNEDSRPLVHTKAALNNEQQLQQQQQQLEEQQQQQLKQRHGSTNTIDGYVNEGICEPEKIISSKFGDSCRQSLTAISTLDTNQFLDNSEFNFKKKYMRETCSANSSPRIFGPSALLKNKGGLSPTEQIELKGAAWFQAGISRDIAVEILSTQSPGSFLVRQSNTKSDCFVLSVRVPPPAPKVAHYLILRTIRGYKIKGFTKEFTSLRALITHHSVMPELLPIPLALPRPTTCTPRRRNLDDFESYGSLRLLGILNMMQSNHNFDRENNS